MEGEEQERGWKKEVGRGGWKGWSGGGMEGEGKAGWVGRGQDEMERDGEETPSRKTCRHDLGRRDRDDGRTGS